ncbi:MAG: M14 family metallopeptidase [Chloroflexota bacterium]
MNFNHYFSNDELENVLQGWVQAYPDLVTLTSLGPSHEKRPIWLLALTNRQSGPAAEKPALWVDANLHATELAGTTAALYLAHALISGYAQDEQCKRLLDTCTFYIAPRLNPDGAALAMAEQPKFIRSGVRPYPYEDKQDGLHAEDVDGDGRILQMRIRDANGQWKVSKLDPRLMEKRAPEEVAGQFYRLLIEGSIENYDGYQIPAAPPLEGLDFNRNYPFAWRGEDEQPGAGPYPASEPEVRAAVDFLAAHSNINVAITFHTFSRVLLRPYSTKADEELPANDLWVFKKLGEIGTRLTGYRCVSTFHDFKYHPKEITTGAFDDWAYDQLGLYSFTIELWDLPTEAGIKERKFIEWWRQHPVEEDVQILKWADEHAPGGYVNWYEFEHPQLGKLELGGWDHLYTWRNPPHTFTEAEVSRHTPWLLALADMLPHISLHTLEAKALGNDTYHLNLVVENSGFFPSYTSEQGKKRKATRPVRVELALPEGAMLCNGKLKTELGHLDGRANDLEVTAFGTSDPTSHRSRAEWVIRARPGSTVGVTVIGERAGTVRREVKLE